MKVILFALCAIFLGATAMVVNTTNIHLSRKLGEERCTWGPSYWCRNLTNAAGCNMTSHCIQKVWSLQPVVEDHDSVCDICKIMVKQARDQLESNQTQEDLKAVFEGSCKLMIIKQVVKECDILVDQFIPELVETIASQMNPSVVCSVSGLCNSPRMNQLILEHEATLKKTRGKIVSLKNDELKPNECSKCLTIGTRVVEKFMKTSPDHLLEEFLTLCRKIGTQSDACANIVLQYFTTIYNHLKEHFNAKKICLLSGQCSKFFHNHEDSADKGPEVEIRPMSSVGMVDVDDDLPCKLCEQLVGHLRDVLIANTTEVEFKRVLNGLCGQTGSFADQCNSIVDEYYPEIYEFLVRNLNGNAVCRLGGICPAPEDHFKEPIMPLLPTSQTSEKIAENKVYVIVKNKKHKNDDSGKDGAVVKKNDTMIENEEMQLPIERFVNPLSLLNAPRMDENGSKLCAFCEYFLHELQQVISDPKSEDEVKMVLGKICKKLPNVIEGMCSEFVDTYGDAIVALLAQEIDPAVICPTLSICPTEQLMKAFKSIKKDMMTEIEVEEKPNCPLCLFAVQHVYNIIKNNNTEANIVNELDKLCDHLPEDMSRPCVDFVNTYSKELINMLLSDFTPQEICVYIKLCNPAAEVSLPIFYPMNKSGEIISNEIPAYEIVENAPKRHIKDDLECILCEHFVKYVEDVMKKNTMKDEVKNIMLQACEILPKNMEKKCSAYINVYADKIIELLSSNVHPKLVCGLLEACSFDNAKLIKESVAECVLCQTALSGINATLMNPTVELKIEKTVMKACDYVPISKHDKCTTMIRFYGQSFFNLLKMKVNTQEICVKVALCSTSDLFALSSEHFRDRRANIDGTKPCTWGDKYVCSSPETAAECNAEEHCRTKVWNREDSPPSSQVAAAIAAANHR